MFRKFLILLLIISIFVFMGCSKKSSSSQQTRASKQNEPKAITSADYETLGERLMTTEALGILRFGLAAPLVLKSIGQPDSKSKSEVWGADGLEHQTWFYKSKGIKLDMVKSKTLTIDMITVNAPFNRTTQRGIGIGSTREQVVNAYRKEIDPKEPENSTDELVVGTVYNGIILKFEKKSGYYHLHRSICGVKPDVRCLC